MLITSHKSAYTRQLLMKLSQVQISLIALSLFQLSVFHLQLESVEGYGEFCYDKLGACKENEVCILTGNTSGVCSCLPGYSQVSQNKTCVSSTDIPHELPASGHTALTVALVFLFVVVGVIGSIGFMYYRYGFFSGAIHSLYRFRRRTASEQAYQITDDGDDVNPIV